MFKKSHKKLAAFLYSVTESLDEVELSFSDFIYGSIRPDLNYSFITKPHYLKNYKQHGVFDKIQQIRQDAGHKVSVEDKAKHSILLGEIVHYMCDYFCFAHNNPKKMLYLISHNRYERRLAHYIEITSFQVPDFNINNAFFDHHFADEHAFIAWLKKMLRQYHTQPRSFRKDVRYALSMSLSVIWYVFQIDVPFPKAFHHTHIGNAANHVA